MIGRKSSSDHDDGMMSQTVGPGKQPCAARSKDSHLSLTTVMAHPLRVDGASVSDRPERFGFGDGGDAK
jgi:hypothetical protein